MAVGDAGDPDGFIVAADAHAAAGTIYGNLMAELGAYLKGACGATSGYAPIQKVYAAAAKLRFALSAAATGGVYQVFVSGKRFQV